MVTPQNEPLQREFRAYLLPVFTSVFLFLVMCYILLTELKHTHKDAEQELIHTAFTVENVLEGSIKSEIRRGRMRRWRLQSILENVIAASNLKFVQLIQNDKTILKLGSFDDLPDQYVTDKNGHKLTASSFFFWRNVKLQECPVSTLDPSQCERTGRGRGSPWWAEDAPPSQDDLNFNNSTQLLIIGLKLDDYRKHIRSAELRIVTSFVIGCIAILTLFAAWSFNLKKQRLNRQYEKMKMRSEQLEEMSLAAVGLAHEIKNPLNIIRGIAQQVTEDAALKACHENASQILDQSDLATERLGDFINYARMKKPVLASIPTRNFLDRIVSVLEPEFNDSGVELVAQSENLVVQADEDMLTQVIINLSLNSLKASQHGQTVRIQATAKGASATISVSDQGIGIPPDRLSDIFKPYVTLFPNGHGIGLSVVKRIIEESDWSIKVDSTPGNGTTMIISDIPLGER